MITDQTLITVLVLLAEEEAQLQEAQVARSH
jgi:hypothetical protein